MVDDKPESTESTAVIRLFLPIWVKPTLKGLDCHEISFYFLMKPRGTKELHSDSYVHGIKEKMYWIPIDRLEHYKAFPSFLKDYLTREHNDIEHIVTDERKGRGLE